MPIYKITETRPAVQIWVYTVEAESQTEALEKVMNGDIDCDDYSTEEALDAESEYEFEEDADDDHEDYNSALLYGVDNNQ